MSDQKDHSSPNMNYQNVLSYYKDKVDALQKERQAWLAKLDECGARMAQKQQKHQKLRKLRNENGTVDTGIVHHAVARLDEQLNTLNLDRQNQNLEFEQAQQLIKMQQLAEQFPIIAEKCIPCLGLLSGDLIDNDLNLHNQGNGAKYVNWDNDGADGQYCQQRGNQNSKGAPIYNNLSINQFNKNGKSGSNFNSNNKYPKSSNKFSNSTSNVGRGANMLKSQSQKNYVKGTNYGKNSKNANIQHGNDRKANNKKTLQQVMKMQITETKRMNDTQIAIMDEQQKILEESIIKLKEGRKSKTSKERNFVKQIEKKYKQLEGKHKQLAENYFNLRRQHKKRNNGVSDENQNLKKTYSVLDDKIAEAMRIYEKQNKAKQALILRKSEDFQQDYKAKMRAKQRNLQALKENYQKMQQLCIDKVRKLQATVERAKFQLQDAEERKKFLVEELRQQLRELEKRVNQQRIQKARIDLRLKQKMLEEKQREEAEKERQQKERKLIQRDQMIKNAYKKTALPQRFNRNIIINNQRQKSVSNEKSKQKQRSRQNSNKKGKQFEKYNLKQNKNKAVNNAESSGQDDSLDMADLDNIRKQIKDLQTKIAKEQHAD